MNKLNSNSFWIGKKVFVTGHTGFKGGWLCMLLLKLGAKVSGYSLEPNSNPSLFNILNLKNKLVNSFIGDIRDKNHLFDSISFVQPDILIHLAAQPLVRRSYIDPIETYSVNIMGTVYLLEIVRKINSIGSVLIVTSDKCYENKEWHWGYRENEPMGGYDPYSSSKGCTELIVNSYRNSFFNDNTNGNLVTGIATARAGNVIGGGDWSEDRLIPDALRAFEINKVLQIRNPNAIRPWQHVLEPLTGYLTLSKSLYENKKEYSCAWNFGPNDEDSLPVKKLLDLLIKKLGGTASWNYDASQNPHEASYLKLDCSKAKNLLGWHPKLTIHDTINYIISWQSSFHEKKDMFEVTNNQINEYLDQ